MSKMLSPEEAEARIPLVLRRAALEIIDCMIQLDAYPVNSRIIESRVMSMQGYMSYLWKLCMTVWRAPKTKPK